ncbi:hypothetical protein Tco_0227039 [Tanacetum coccineum]
MAHHVEVVTTDTTNNENPDINAFSAQQLHKFVPQIVTQVTNNVNNANNGNGGNGGGGNGNGGNNDYLLRIRNLGS